MAITYVGAGSNAASNGDPTDPTLPTGWAADDLFILQVGTVSGETITTPTGWTLLGTVSSSDSGETNSIYYRVAQSGDSAPSVDDSGVVTLATVTAFRNVSTTSPIHASQSSEDNTTDTTGSITGLTTTKDGCMILACQAHDNDASHSSWTNSNLASITEAYDNTWNPRRDQDASISLAYGILSSAGSTGATTVTKSLSVGEANWCIALLDVAQEAITRSATVGASGAVTVAASIIKPRSATIGAQSAGTTTYDSFYSGVATCAGTGAVSTNYTEITPWRSSTMSGQSGNCAGWSWNEWGEFVWGGPKCVNRRIIKTATATISGQSGICGGWGGDTWGTSTWGDPRPCITEWQKLYTATIEGTGSVTVTYAATRVRAPTIAADGDVTTTRRPIRVRSTTSTGQGFVSTAYNAFYPGSTGTSATGQVHATSTVIRPRTATAAADGDVTVTYNAFYSANSTITADGDVSVTSTVTRPRAVTIAADGDVSTTRYKILPRSSTVAADGDVNTTYNAFYTATSVISGEGAVTVDYNAIYQNCPVGPGWFIFFCHRAPRYGTAQVTAFSGGATNRYVIKPRSATITADGDVTVSAKDFYSRSATISADGDVTATYNAFYSASATCAASGSVNVTSTVIRPRSTTSTGQGNVTVAYNAFYPGSTGTSAYGQVHVQRSIIKPRSSTITSAGDLNSTSTVYRVRTSTIAADGDVSASWTQIKFRTATILADGELDVARNITRGRLSTVAADGDVDSSRYIIKTRSATISGQGFLSTANLQRSATIEGQSAGTTARTVIRARTATISSEGNVITLHLQTKRPTVSGEGAVIVNFKKIAGGHGAPGDWPTGGDFFGDTGDKRRWNANLDIPDAPKDPELPVVDDGPEIVIGEEEAKPELDLKAISRRKGKKPRKKKEYKLNKLDSLLDVDNILDGVYGDVETDLSDLKELGKLSEVVKQRPDRVRAEKKGPSAAEIAEQKAKEQAELEDYYLRLILLLEAA